MCRKQAEDLFFVRPLSGNGHDVKGPPSRTTLLRRDANSVVIMGQWGSKDDSIGEGVYRFYEV